MRKRFNVASTVRLWFLLKNYARPYWVSFMVLALLNFLLFGVGILTTATTKAVIDVLTMQPRAETTADQAPGIMGFLSIEDIGNTLIHTVGLNDIESQFNSIVALAVVSLILVVIKCSAQYGGGVLSSWTSLRISRSLKLDLYQHYMNLSVGFFNRNRVGALISRMELDTTRSTGGFNQIINSAVVSPLLIAFYMVLTIRASWVLFMAIILAALTHYGLTAFLSGRVKKNTKASLNIGAHLKSIITEVFTSIRVVKSFVAEPKEIKKIAANLDTYTDISVEASKLNQLQAQGRLFINTIVQLIVLVFAAFELKRGVIDESDCLFFIFICASIVSPITQIGNALVTIGSMGAASQRVYKYFRMEPEVVDGDQRITEFSDSIQVKDVYYSYAGKPAINGVSLKVKRGQTVALVGPSGSGKSTLVDLILRICDPSQGTVEIDGVDIKQYQQSDYRKLFGIVSQESLLFNMPVKDNIGYGREELCQEDVEAAAKIANAHEFILEMPLGYDTSVGDRGVRMSGGQRQRLAIARAVAGDPQVLILDEATSSLDSSSEKEVQKAIDQVTRSATALVIAHRLSTVRDADAIAVMDNGKILSVGTHEELYESLPLYRKLCSNQFGLEQSQGDEN